MSISNSTYSLQVPTTGGNTDLHGMECVTEEYPLLADDSLVKGKAKQCCGCCTRRTCLTRGLFVAALLTVVVAILGVYVLPQLQFSYHPHTKPTKRIPPDPPSLSIVSSNSTTVSLAWNKPQANTAQITSFQLQRNTSNASIMDGYALTFTDSELLGSHHYCYIVRAVSSAGASNSSNITCATTLAPGVPGVATRLAPLTATSDSVVFTWQSAPNGGSNLTGYTVQKKHGITAWKAVDGCAAPGNQTCRAAGLQGATSYTFRIAATNSVGQGPWGSEVTFHTDHSAVKAPSKMDPPVQKGVGHDFVSVTWKSLNPTDDGGGQVIAYTLEYRLQSKTNYTKAFRGFQPLEFRATGLLAKSTYCFRLRAENSQGGGAWSDDACFATQDAQVPQAPVISEAPLQTTPSSIQVGWTVPNTGGSPIRSYSLQRDDYWVDRPFFTAYSGLENQFNATLHLLPATTYRFRVSAHNDIGDSQFSAVRTFTTDRNGACGNPSDVAAYKATKTTMKKTIQGCLLSCVVSGSVCAQQCISNKVGLSKDCATCWVDEGHCTEKNCIAPCLQPSSQACARCSKQKCFPDCVACSGIPLYFFPP